MNKCKLCNKYEKKGSSHMSRELCVLTHAMQRDYVLKGESAPYPEGQNFQIFKADLNFWKTTLSLINSG